jgi:hypothetical protein
MKSNLEKILTVLEKKSETENDFGNKIEYFRCDSERYFFDFRVCTSAQGWAQYDTDQDAWYFGVWVHKDRRLVLTYSEGDLSLVTCASLESFAAELTNMGEFYGAAPPMAVSIDNKGQMTEYYDTRPTAE